MPQGKNEVHRTLGQGNKFGCQGKLSVPIADSALGQIIGGHLDGDPVARGDANSVLSDPARGVAQSRVLVLKPDLEQRVGQQLLDHALKLDGVFLRHSDPLLSDRRMDHVDAQTEKATGV